MQTTNARLVQSLNAKIRAEAKQRKTTADNIRHQFAFALFFKQLFQDGNSNWLLLGGNALLIRTHGGRYTQDIDLARSTEWLSIEEIEQELHALLSTKAVTINDPAVRFSVLSVREGSDHDAYDYGSKTVNAKIQMTLSGIIFHSFSIDISAQRHIYNPVDKIALQPVLQHELLTDLPLIPIIPIENHLADKICALYELHGSTQTASTRYRDLADIVRIIQTCTFNAQKVATLLEHESKRRKITLPQRLHTPSTEWHTAYPRQCREYADYPRTLYNVDSAIQFAGEALNCILDRSRISGFWDPQALNWSMDSPERITLDKPTDDSLEQHRKPSHVTNLD